MGLTMEHRFTDEQLQQLADAAAPCSEVAQAIRARCGDGFLEPPDVRYVAHVDSCLVSIGAGEVVAPDVAEVEQRMRAAGITVADYRLTLSRWEIGWPRGRARGEFLIDQGIVDEVYDTLGDVNDANAHQKAVIRMMVDRLDPVTKDLTVPKQFHDRLGAWDPPQPANVEERFFHDITRLDLDTWKIVVNIQAMIRNIAAQDRVAEVHCWIGNPADIPALRRRVEAIRDWFDGNTETADTRDIVTTLGDVEAYREKRWLAASLLCLLETHAEDERVLRLMR